MTAWTDLANLPKDLLPSLLVGIITVIPGDENVLDLHPTELIAHLPHPIHKLVWCACGKCARAPMPGPACTTTI